MDKRSHLFRERSAATARRLPLFPLAAALLLGGCSSSDKVEELEKRLTVVEAKAEAAEKRAKAAESFAERTAPTPYVNNDDQGPSPDLDPDANQVTDDSANDPAFSNDIAPPPPPAPLISDGTA